MSSTISPTSAVSTGSVTSRIPIQVLGQEDFLKLLSTQMTTQDPLNPQSDTQFIAQMAQFSALENSKSMQADLAQLRSAQELMQADGLLGKTVSLQVSKDVTAEGVVSAVEIEEGTPKLVVNGQQFDLDQVISVSSGLSSNSLNTLTNYARISQLGR